MDIVKQVYENNKIVRFNENGEILVNGEQIEVSASIFFTTVTRSSYTMDTVLLFMTCHTQSHSDYVNECARLNILPVKLIDKEKIISEIKEYTPPRKIGSFIFPTYTYNSSFHIPEINHKF